MILMTFYIFSDNELNQIISGKFLKNTELNNKLPAQDFQDLNL